MASVRRTITALAVAIGAVIAAPAGPVPAIAGPAV